ncbi:hypothetical protein [Algoriphagus sp. C2-6-M1]|uniref:hypothetical protein n=1 Tax=Algoriphagus persicinus TaxID=3108754 RepID=UPI002B405B45|nr:hypothetical protein [Algoriphagus sp. C2-6-M1]
MVEEAQKRGADAVLILGLDEILTESATTTSGSTRKDEKGINNTKKGPILLFQNIEF